jgi:hypothetical protein
VSDAQNVTRAGAALKVKTGRSDHVTRKFFDHAVRFIAVRIRMVKDKVVPGAPDTSL